MISPRLIVDRAGRISRLFGRNWVAYLRYAVERETSTMRYALPMTYSKKRFKTNAEAVDHCENVILPKLKKHYEVDDRYLPRIYCGDEA